MALSDYLDLRTAVVEMIGNADIVDVFDRQVLFAENQFNRRLRTREMITTTPVTVSSGVVALPADQLEIISLATTSGVEYVQTPLQVYDKLTTKDGFYAIDGTNINATDADYQLRYYAKIPTLTGGVTSTNWLLTKHPELYMYVVAERCARHIGNLDLASSAAGAAEQEYNYVNDQDYSERFARARVRVAGVNP